MADLKKYAFEEENVICIFLIPGYSEGLSAEILNRIAQHFSARRGTDVIGLKLDYASDTPDLFNRSQRLIKENILSISDEYPHKKIYVVAKSLGASLLLGIADKVSVTGIVALGFPVILGNPPRISLLGDAEATAYTNEWTTILRSLQVPLTCLYGADDDLFDKSFMASMTSYNDRVKSIELNGTSHSLADSKTGIVQHAICISEIEGMISNT